MIGIRRRARTCRAGLVLSLVSLPLAATGVATAAPPAPGTITPILECVAVDPSGGYTAVLGYSNSSATTVTVPHGRSNMITPARYGGERPTTFLPGRQPGVFSLTVENGAPDLVWTVDGSSVRLSPRGPGCPAPTEMPVDGNGTGVALGLGVAGLFGVVLLRRMQRRLAVADPAPTPAPAPVPARFGPTDA